MPSPRFGRLDSDKRETLLAAARAEFAEYGFEASSYNRIIANSGLSKGSFYYYFDGKDDLYLTVVQDAVARFSEAVGDPGEANTVDEFWAECGKLYRQLLSFGIKYPALVGVLRSLANLRTGQAADDLMKQFMVKDTEWYSGLILRGQQLGAIREDLPLDLLLGFLYALIQAKARWGLHRWPQYGPAEIEEHVALMVDVFRRIATPAPPGAPDTPQFSFERAPFERGA